MLLGKHYGIHRRRSQWEKRNNLKGGVKAQHLKYIKDWFFIVVEVFRCWVASEPDSTCVFPEAFTHPLNLFCLSYFCGKLIKDFGLW